MSSVNFFHVSFLRLRKLHILFKFYFSSTHRRWVVFSIFWTIITHSRIFPRYFNTNKWFTGFSYRSSFLFCVFFSLFHCLSAMLCCLLSCSALFRLVAVVIGLLFKDQFQSITDSIIWTLMLQIRGHKYFNHFSFIVLFVGILLLLLYVINFSPSPSTFRLHNNSIFIFSFDIQTWPPHIVVHASGGNGITFVASPPPFPFWRC